MKNNCIVLMCAIKLSRTFFKYSTNLLLRYNDKIIEMCAFVFNRRHFFGIFSIFLICDL